MKIVQIVLRMEFESINTSKKHYITVHYKKILRHGALSYRYERLLFFLILFKNKISYSRNNRKTSPYSWVFKTAFNPCSTKNGNSTCDSKRPKTAILVSSEDIVDMWNARIAAYCLMSCIIKKANCSSSDNARTAECLMVKIDPPLS